MRSYHMYVGKTFQKNNISDTLIYTSTYVYSSGGKEG